MVAYVYDVLNKSDWQSVSLVQQRPGNHKVRIWFYESATSTARNRIGAKLEKSGLEVIVKRDQRG